jgi:dynein heavy chain
VLQGDEIALNLQVGCFITMNPGYLGRSELPEGLKALFRPITVMVPDFQLIIENMFMGEGFTEAMALGLKFATLYSLNKDLLSASKKYDWGMRAIKSVLVVAGGFKRADPTLTEQAVLMRSLRDTNVAKIEGDDLKVFMGLLQDLFPGINPPRFRDNEMEETLIAVMEEDYGYTHDPDGYLLLKITQLIELLGIRHCVFLMGNPGSFKSAMWKVLKNAKTRRGERTTVIDFSPKAINTNELYGFVNMATREWKDGILSWVMRHLGQIPDTHPKWIMLDGDLDANWIESMNSVMDDNRLLTLPSNERIQLKQHMKMIFEIRDLNFATPATATRAGIVCMDDSEGVQWRSYVASWIKKQEHPDNIKESLHKYFDKYGQDALVWIYKNTKKLVDTVNICLMSACTSLLESLLTADKYEVLEYWFIFCFVAAVGFCLMEKDGVDYRKAFDKWWRQEMKTIKYPSKGTVFDYYVKETKFEEWSSAVEEITYSSETPMGEVTVPTSETVAMTFIMKALMKVHHPIMLVGLAGCGKTQSCLGLLRGLDASEFGYYAMNMSYYTDSTLLQAMMENPLEKKAGKLYAPPGKLQLIYFIDDLNMQALDKYNTQDSIELLKQKQDYSHWWDRNKIQVKDIGNTQYMCCMNPTAGSFIVNPRLQRHFWICAVPFPETPALRQIYATFMKGHFERLPFKSSVQETVSGIISGAISLYWNVVEKFKKTAANFHYEFNIRHMSGVFNGLLAAKPTEFVDAEKLVLLWVHESERIYGDRLVSVADLKKYRGIAAELSKKMFGKYANTLGKYFHETKPEPLVFAPFSKGIAEMDGGGTYDKINGFERLQELLEGALNEYNENNAAMDLVLFGDAMCHVAKICRIITSTPGHPLLVGVGGSGRQSLSRLSSFTCTYDTKMIVISGSYGMNELKTDLQSYYNKAGVKDEGVMFLFTDGQITNEKFLVFINDLLASGDIADLYATDEKDPIRNAVRSGCKGAGIQDTPENLWMFFIGRIRRNLHMSLCFSPVNDIRGRARKFPALVNCTVIDWFQMWPMDALYNVGLKFLTPVEQLGASDSPVRMGIIEFLPFSYESSMKQATEFMNNERRFAYTTPKSFLELIMLYTSMVGKKVDALEDQKDRLTNGLEKLRKTQLDVAELEEQLKVKAVVVKEKVDEATKFEEQVSIEKAQVDVEAAKAGTEAENANKIAVTVNKQKADCERDLAEAEPLVRAAESALDVLDKKDFQELKALNKPPPGVDDVLFCAMHLQATIDPSLDVDKKGNCKNITWQGALKMINAPERFLENLKAYKEEINAGKVPQQNVENARKIKNAMGDTFTYEGMLKKSGACAGLCTFIINIIMYYDVVITVEPKRQALREAEEKLSNAMQSKESAEERVRVLQAKLAELMKAYDKAISDKNAVVAEAEKCQVKLDMAQRLVNALSANGVIWEQTVARAAEDLEYIPGDTLVACSFASYVGVFTRKYREVCVGNYVDFLRKHHVPLSGVCDPLKVLATDADMAAWNTQGLPSDRVSCENGSIATNSQRWPLIVDPQLQGIVWIKNKEQENGLQITRMGAPKMLSIFEVALDQGKSVLIENMGENIDAVLQPVVSRNTIKRGNKRVVKVGDKEIIFRDKFKLFMQTKLSNPHYQPEIQAETTVINFTVTEDGLEDQVLFLVVKLERPDLAKKKAELIQQQNEFKVTLAHLEALLLEKLANAEGDILDDTELILSLEEAKKTSDEVKEKVIYAQDTEAKINETSEFYRPSGVRGSLLFFLLCDLFKMHTFYKYSLDSFLGVVTRAVNSVSLRVPKTPKAAAVAEATAGDEENKDGDDAADDDDDDLEEAGGGDIADEDDEEEEIPQLHGKELMQRVKLLEERITYFVFVYTRRGLLDSDKLTVASMMALKILVRSGEITQDESTTLIRAPPDPNPPTMPENARSWLTDMQWAQMKSLEGMDAFKKSGKLTESLEQDSLGWKRWWQEEKAETADLPRSARDLGPFHRLFLLRILRQDRIKPALTQFIIDKLGQEYVEQSPFDMEQSLEESTPHTPFFFVLFPGVDPTPVVESLGRKLGLTEANGKFINISMGQGQENVALNSLGKAAKEGAWIMLQNIHLMQAWLKQLERHLEIIEEFAVPEFRCFLTSEPPGAMQGRLWDLIPEPILQRCIKVADEAPQDLKSNLRRAYSKFSQDSIDECSKPKEFKAALFALCFFHALISGRIKFGAQGWSKKYPFNDGDLTICGQVLRNYLNNSEVLGTDVPWPDLRYIFGEIMYGGHITDFWDRRINNYYLSVLVIPDLLTGLTLAPGPSSFKSPDPAKMEYVNYTKYIEERFPPENPQMFWLHPNAEINYLTSQGVMIFSTIAEITGGGGGGKGGGDISAATPIMNGYQSQLPPNLDMFDIRQKVKPEDITPFILVSFAEGERMNELLNTMRFSMIELEMGIGGQLNISEKMEALATDLQMNKVNPLWGEKAYASLKLLKPWFEDLLERVAQVLEWNQKLALLKSICLSFLFNPMSFLTSNMQIAARTNSLPLDYMTNRCRFYNTRSFNDVPVAAKGVNVHGFFMEGAGWEDGKGEEEGYIAPSKMKDLHPVMPFCNVYAVHIDDMDWNAMYHCPVFSTSLRGATFVFQANVRMDPDEIETTWILAGAALLLQDD